MFSDIRSCCRFPQRQVLLGDEVAGQPVVDPEDQLWCPPLLETTPYKSRCYRMPEDAGIGNLTEMA
jgi:hypothetical protein